jgi:putative aldouronate transport system substrate-binding protein
LSRKKQSRARYLFMLLFMSVLAGCQGASEGKISRSEMDQDRTAGGAVEINIFAKQNAAEPVPKDHPIIAELEKKTNSSLNITWIPTNTLNERTKITLASGDIYDMMYVDSVYDPQFVQAALAGAFWDLTPYIKEYKNLSGLPAEAWENTRINGKNYGVPRPRPLDGGGAMPMIRKDWIEKLGLQMPQTLDELYMVAKAMTEKDPDGNGKADTYGFAGNVEFNEMGSYSWVEQTYTMTKGKWQLKEGKLSPTFFDPRIKDSLEYLKKAYDEKVLPPDFAVLKFSQARDNFMGNKAGILGSAVKPQWLFMEAILKIDPKADVYPLPYISGPDGSFASKSSGYLGIYAIPKSIPEAKMKKIVAVMDLGVTDEVSNIANYGLKDIHYKVAEGDSTYIIFTEQAVKDNIPVIVNNTSNLFTSYNNYFNAFYAGIPREYYERNKKVIDERSKMSIADPAEGIFSNTYLMIGPDIEKKMQDLKVKIILGKEPMSAWDSFVAKLKSDVQLQKAIQEMNDAYNRK